MAKPLQPFKGVPTGSFWLGRRPVVLALTLFAAGGAAAQPNGPQGAGWRAVIFPFVLDDTSLEGEMRGTRIDQQARLGRLDGQLRALLAQAGRCVLVDTAPVAAEAAARDLRSCTACAIDMAQRLGAQVAVIPWVQKVSNLILNINVTILDASDGRVVAGGSVDIRGNTDESWSRGVRYLVRERLLAAPWVVAP
jgi:hypothetical protein